MMYEVNISSKAHSKSSLVPSREKKENHGKLSLNEKDSWCECNEKLSNAISDEMLLHSVN